MKKLIAFALLVSACGGSSSEPEWTRNDVAWEISYAVCTHSRGCFGGTDADIYECAAILHDDLCSRVTCDGRAVQNSGAVDACLALWPGVSCETSEEPEACGNIGW